MIDLRQKFVRHISHPLLLWKWGDLGVLDYLKEFERTQYLSADDLHGLQLRRLQALLDHAYRNCPFYREQFDRAGVLPSDIKQLADLRFLPILEKRQVQQERDRMLASGWPKDDLIENQTGGSTGTPIAFCYSRDRHRARAAATLRHNRWAGWDIGDRVAYVWGAPRDTPLRGLRARIREALTSQQIYLDTSHLTEAKMARFNEALKSFRPKVIQAYAGSIVLLARYLKAQGLATYQPGSIVTSAEVLDPEGRALLKEVFGCPIFDRYGCRELSVVASECDAHAGLHTMAEGLLVEVSPCEGKSPLGTLGAILVTDLLNPAMPLIRYRIGDMGTWAEGPCTCGRALPRLQRVVGRVTEMLVGSDGRLVSGVYLATYVVAARPSLGQVQIQQDKIGEILFRIKPGLHFESHRDFAYIKEASQRYLGPDLKVDFTLVDEELAAEPSGKFIFSRSTVTPSYLA
jgi:phenylacetate-CoA ligase